MSSSGPGSASWSAPEDSINEQSLRQLVTANFLTNLMPLDV